MRPPDWAQRERALELSRHVIVIAPAGSGKTGLLVQRMLTALATVTAPEQVVALTFTNKAAAEIRERVVHLLGRAAAGDTTTDAHDAGSLAHAAAALAQAREIGWDPQADPERLQALTLDGFNTRLAAEQPLLSGLGGYPRVTEDARGLYDDAVLAAFDAALADDADPALREAAATWLRGANNRLDRLAEPLADLLARREQWAPRLLGEAWSEARDAELLAALHRDRQQALGEALGAAYRERLLAAVRLGSEHCERLTWAAGLRGWPPVGAEHAEVHRALADLLVTKEGALRKPRGIDKTLGFPPQSPAKAQLAGLLSEIAERSDIAAAAAAVRDLPGVTMPPPLARLRDHLRVLLRRALAELRLAMAAHGEVDFGEIAQAALTALRPEGEDAGAGDALLKRDAQIRHLLVDEMQDTSEAQLELLRQLTQDWQAGDGRSLFLVGDPQQSIYAFRKAEVRLFLELWRQRRLGMLQLEPVQLSANFRSAPPVIAWCNRTFAAAFPPRDDAYAGEVAYRPADAAARCQGEVAIHGFVSSTDAMEAVAAADRAAALMALPAAEHGSIAILARARAHLAGVLAELRRRGVGYACQDVDPLAASPAVRDLLACARALWHPEDRLHWTILLRAPWVGLSWSDLLALSSGRREQPWPQRLREADVSRLSADGRLRVARFTEALQAVQADLARGTLAERVEALWLRLGGPACVGSTGLTDARRALDLLRRHTGEGIRDLPAFERAVTELYASPAEGAVQVMTIHKAKGLEFDHVLLVGCGRAPRRPDTPLLQLVDTPHGALLVPRPPDHWPNEAIAASAGLFEFAHRLHAAARNSEAVRLLYVAATRAKRTLHLYATVETGADGEPKPRAGSFAAWLWPSIRESFRAGETATAPTMDSRVPRAPRLALPYTPPTEEGLYVPRTTRTVRPSERVLSAREAKREQDELGAGGVYARLLGTQFHQAMARLADQGIDAWLGDTASHPRALAAGFRRLGLPEPQVPAAVQRVLSLVERVLTSKRGRWLLAPKRWAASEYALTGWRDGEWVAAVIDRCFEDDDGRLWVIDYKITAQPLAPDEVEQYAAQCLARYAPQLATYAELLAAQRAVGGEPRRATAALYLPELDRLLHLD